MDYSAMKTFYFLLFSFLALAYSGTSNAVITVTPTTLGVASGMYRPAALPTFTGTSFSATSVVNINGSPYTIASRLPSAASAAQWAKTTLFSFPLLTGVSLLAWSGAAGLGSDAVGNWVKETPSTDPHQNRILPVDASVAGCRSDNGGLTVGACDATMQLCASPSVFGYLTNGRTCVAFKNINGVNTNLGGYNTDPIVYTGSNAGKNLQIAPYGDCPAGTISTTGSTCAPSPVKRPATQADFDALPAPPMAALADLAPQRGVPVQPLQFDAQTFPTGNPYTKPDGSTVQPMARVSPVGDGRAYVDTYNQPLTDAAGAPVPSTAPKEQTSPDPTSEPSPTQCEKFPLTLGCASLDIPSTEELGNQNPAISLIQPVSVGSAGSCPAPLTASALGQTVSLSFDPLCLYANTLRPLVLALSWLSAGLIFFGGVRNG